MSNDIRFHVLVSVLVTGPDDPSAVMFGSFRTPESMHKATIADARAIANLLAKAADEAESKLPDDPARRIDDSIDPYLS